MQNPNKKMYKTIHFRIYAVTDIQIPERRRAAVQ